MRAELADHITVVAQRLHIAHATGIGKAAREAALLREAVMASAGSDCGASCGGEARGAWGSDRGASCDLQHNDAASPINRSAAISNRGKGKHQKQGSDKSKGQDKGKA